LNRAAKLVQAEYNGKKNIIFLAIVEAPPNFDQRSTLVQAEYNGKKNDVFLAIVEAPPNSGPKGLSLGDNVSAR
jgi:hypothetical protein